MAERIALTVRGTVQGVGFRPFVYRLARRHSLSGWVRNSSGPVEIEVEGEGSALGLFVTELRSEAPPLARIESLVPVAVAAVGGAGFRILESERREGDFQPVSPDAATCDDCLAEITDPSDRRYGYPFTNCTNCGPRFTIIEALPYDRSSTTMRDFTMCMQCQSEYDDPDNRRFHAQPNACPVCGPQLSMPIAEAADALRHGLIVALKGLGGYQLACDAANESAVARMRERKRRPFKPFAVMTDEPADLCDISEDEWVLLRSPARPIVLLSRSSRPALELAWSLAPHLNELGVMLPYTPLHHLLARDFGAPMVMTSGNLSEEPICIDNQEAEARLGGIADIFIHHDRQIAVRYDDSVVRWAAGAARVQRRARGLAPEPIRVPEGPPTVATGAHLKAAFTVARDGRAFVGQHIGDLDDLLTRRAYDEALGAYRRLFDVTPLRVGCDLHPDYASTRVAEMLVPEPVRVQHHHAHVASVIAEHRLDGKVAGIALDGVGLGPDGTVWGGEVLICDATEFRRVAHLAPVSLPGGDLCAREGWRMAAAYGLETAPPGVDSRRFELVRRLAASGTVPVTTSAGRLFDAVASLLGVLQESSYEGEAAIRLEAIASEDETEVIEMDLEESDRLFSELGARIGRDSAGKLSAIFHNSLAAAVVRACVRTGLKQAALSGGCFQNKRLLETTFSLLRQAGITPYANERVPANDGGLSLGQALVAQCS